MAPKDIIKKVNGRKYMQIIYLMSIDYPEFLQLNYKEKTNSFF